MFAKSMAKAVYMGQLDKTLEENPPTGKHTKLLCSKLQELLLCVHQTEVTVDVNFGDVADMNSRYEKTITIVNNTGENFKFCIRRINLKNNKEDEERNKFEIENNGDEVGFFSLENGESHDLSFSFYCDQLNSFQFEYFELSYQISKTVTIADNSKDVDENKLDKSNVIRKKTERKAKMREHAKQDALNKIEHIKLNSFARQVCEMRHKTYQSSKKLIKLNLSGVCMSPKVSANKKIIKIQGSQKKSFKIFNDSMRKSAYIQIDIDTVNCPIQLSCLCAVIKPKSSISVNVTLKLNLFVSEYFHKRVFIRVLNHEPINLDIFSCFHTHYIIENMDCAEKLEKNLHLKFKEITPDEKGEEQNKIETDIFEDESVLENFFKLDIEQYIKIKPNSLHMTRYYNSKEFSVKNQLNVKMFVIWNRDSLNKIRIHPNAGIINEKGSATFRVEYEWKEQESFHRIEIDCSLYYGDKLVDINLNQGKYEVRPRRLNLFLPYSSSITLCAHNFRNGHSWIPNYCMTQENFTFQFLLNNYKQTSMAFSSMLIKNTGNLPLHYSTDKINRKSYEFETSPNCNYIKNNSNIENFHIVYSYLRLKAPVSDSFLKKKLSFHLNTDPVYNEVMSYKIYSDQSLGLTVPLALLDCQKIAREKIGEFVIEGNGISTKSVNSTNHLKGEHNKTDLDDGKVNTTNVEENSNITSTVIDPTCLDNFITDYLVVKFPTMHPTCSTNVNIPLYNSSQHTIFYEMEIIDDVEKMEDIFSIQKTEGHLLSNQLLEIKCSFHPKKSGDFKRFVRCNQKCLIHGVKIENLFFLLKGNAIESALRCHPGETIYWDNIQSQFFTNETFEIENTANCTLNFLLRCSLEREKEVTIESKIKIIKFSDILMSKKTSERSISFNRCHATENETPVNAEGVQFYEDLLRKADRIDKNDGKIKTKFKSGGTNCPKEGKETLCDVKKIQESDEIVEMEFIDDLDLSPQSLHLNNCLRKDFILLDPFIGVLKPNERKVIDYVFHPFTSGRCRLDIKLFVLTNAIDDDTALLTFNEAQYENLLKIHYNCIDGYLQIVDIIMTSTGGSKCFSMHDYYYKYWKIPELNEKLMCKDSRRLMHEVYLPSFEAGKEVSCEIAIKNMTNASHFHIINIQHGICNVCYGKAILGQTNVRVCKHFLKNIHIDPKLLEFEENVKILKISVNYGTEEFSQFIRKNTRDNKTEYYTTFCLYVNNSTHSMCIIKKYVHLTIKANTIVDLKVECGSFILPRNAGVITLQKTPRGNSSVNTEILKEEHADFGQELVSDMVRFYKCILYKSKQAQPFWLFNNTKHIIVINARVVEQYSGYVKIVTERFTMKKNSKYPILFLFDMYVEIDHFVFEFFDSVTLILRNITVSVYNAEDCANTESNKVLSFSSPSILSTNPLIIHAIPLHHTTTRLITFKNIYNETVIFNWNSIYIHGVVKLDIEPKFGSLKPRQCKQVKLTIQSLLYPSKLTLVLAVELYKEKHYTKYFDTLRELCEIERQRSDIYHSGSGDGETIRGTNIEEYRIHARPNPNVQTISVELSTYNVLDRLTPDDILEEGKVHKKLNLKLNNQYKTQYLPGCKLKQNKSLLGDIKSVFHETFWYLLKKVSYENHLSKDIVYEELKYQESEPVNVDAKSMVEEIFGVIFEKVLYHNVCNERIREDAKSSISSLEESYCFHCPLSPTECDSEYITVEPNNNCENEKVEEQIEDIKIHDTLPNGNLLTTYDTIKSFLVQAIEEGAGSQVHVVGESDDISQEPHLSKKRNGNEPLVENLEALDDDFNDISIGHHPVSKKNIKKNALGMNNDYYYDNIMMF